MSKVAATYWDNNTVLLPAPDSRPKTRPHASVKREKATPQWFVFAVVVFIASTLCTTINLRAFSELKGEIQQNQKLNFEADQLANQNLALQEDIHRLKTDSRAIGREARKLGMGRVSEKILVP